MATTPGLGLMPMVTFGQAMWLTRSCALATGLSRVTGPVGIHGPAGVNGRIPWNEVAGTPKEVEPPGVVKHWNCGVPHGIVFSLGGPPRPRRPLPEPRTPPRPPPPPPCEPPPLNGGVPPEKLPPPLGGLPASP